MSLEDTLTNLSLYDAKKYFRKAQNLVYNYTDMESKVREATNNEPWGTPSTLMEQISQGSFNYKERTEIIGMIFKRFTEKTSVEWRQIYKALQLLEYIIKHGSERFIDDCRSNLSLVAMLKDFHYIDSQGNDQGLNVRTRATAIVDLLKDNEKIRTERKKAKEVSNKFKGISSSDNSAGFAGRTGGFTKSNKKGISVSADFDDANEVRNYHTYDDKSYGEYKEEYIVEIKQAHEKDQHKDLNHEPLADLLDTSSAPVGNNLVDEENDDEFSDFQSAPVSKTAVPAVSNLQFDFNDNSKNIVLNTSKAATKSNDDPFASLFSDAKTQKVDKTNIAIAPNAKSSGNDNEFGDFMSFGTEQKNTASLSNNSNKNNSAEIDLLSF
ncbi:hypothetical protein QEN19_004406 [Hanseniaspora menglaensis]